MIYNNSINVFLELCVIVPKMNFQNRHTLFQKDIFDTILFCYISSQLYLFSNFNFLYVKYRINKMFEEMNIPINGRKIRVCAKKGVYKREEGGSNGL